MKKLVISIAIAFFISILPLFPNRAFGDTDNFDYTNYVELEWLQSDGTAYIDSGIKPDRNTIIESKWEGGTSGMFYGVNSSGGSTGFYQFYINSGKYVARFVTSNVITPTQSSLFSNPFTVVTNPRSEFTLTDGTTTITKSASISSTAVPTRNMYIFTNNSQGTVGNFTNAKLYYFYVKDFTSGSYTHKFIPALRKSDQKVGLYDTVDGTFLFNSSGSFTYGGSVPTRYVISTSVSPAGSGTVSGGGEYDSESVIQLTATPNTGYEFVRWSDNSTDNPLTVTVTSSQSYTAYFQQISVPTQRYTVTTNVSPAGSGTVSGGGTYDSGTLVTLTATPNNGYEFNRWSDGVVSASRSFTINSDVTFNAEFVASSSPTQTYTVTTNVSPSGSGTVSGGGTYAEGTNITLTANPSSGYVFASWSDGSTANPRNLQITSNVNLTAYFSEDLSSRIVLGANLDLVSLSRDISYPFYGHYYSGTSVDYNYWFYPYEPVNSEYQIDNNGYVYRITVVLNDDYLGSMTCTMRLKSDNSLVSFSGDRFINGNTMTFYISRINTALFPPSYYSFTFDTSKLVKKLTSENLLQDGTQDSNESAQQLDDSNDQLNESVGQLTELESSFTDDMNESLQQIDVGSSSPNNWGSNFLTSAQWVSQQFNRMTTNTPYGSILGFSLALGIALLIIGKVLG